MLNVTVAGKNFVRVVLHGGMMVESIVVRVKKVSTPLKRNILTLMDMG